MLGWTSAALGIALLVGCGADERIDGHFSAQEWQFLQSFRLPPLDPCPRALAPTPARCVDAAALGRGLFFDRSYAGKIVVAYDGVNGGLGAVNETGKVSCADCHMPEAWFIDVRSVPNATSLGAGWTGRNTPSLVDAAYQRELTWDGRFPDLAAVLAAPLEKPALLNSSPRALAEAIQRDHRAAYDAVFDPDLPAGPLADAEVARIRDDAAIAIEAYERTLVSGASPFDRYLDGDVAAIAEPAKRGLALFIGPALCAECHRGPLLGGDGYHATGVMQHRPGAASAHVPAIDHGRGAITSVADDEGRFRTPGLRHVAETAPYMHAGQVATLTEVIELYRWGGDAQGFAGHKDELMMPLALTDADVGDLEGFLRTLTGQPVVEHRRP